MSEFWNRVGLLLFIIGTLGWFTDFSVISLRWVYLFLLAIGTILYIGKEKNEK
jgi:hypothetical protein